MTPEQIIRCYNSAAGVYAQNLFRELENKPLDKLMLTHFAFLNKSKGKMLDIGCGPGQTTRYLWQAGASDILGIDISPGMIDKARSLSPDIEFEQGDMLKLNYKDGSFGSAIAFYAIVHLSGTELVKAFSEISRVLIPEGNFLLSFHVGKETVKPKDLFGVPVDIDFYFFESSAIIDLLDKTGFTIVNAVERDPYPDKEHPSRRAYLWVRKT